MADWKIILLTQLYIPTCKVLHQAGGVLAIDLAVAVYVGCGLVDFNIPTCEVLHQTGRVLAIDLAVDVGISTSNPACRINKNNV